MGMSTFSGPVRSLNGFIDLGPGAIVTINGNVTLDPVLHAGKTLRITSATAVITLPTIIAGAADPAPDNPSTLGARYDFTFDINTTALDIATDQTDKFVGSLTMQGTTMLGFSPAATNDHIKPNGTTSGGRAGSQLSIVALAALKYQVFGTMVCTGTPITPFSDT